MRRPLHRTGSLRDFVIDAVHGARVVVVVVDGVVGRGVGVVGRVVGRDDAGRVVLVVVVCRVVGRLPFP